MKSSLCVHAVNLQIFVSLAALKETGGSYVINGDWSVSSSRQYDAAGSVVRYYRPPAGAVHNNREYIYIEGPTTVSLDVLVGTPKGRPLSVWTCWYVRACKENLTSCRYNYVMTLSWRKPNVYAFTLPTTSILPPIAFMVCYQCSHHFITA